MFFGRVISLSGRALGFSKSKANFIRSLATGKKMSYEFKSLNVQKEDEFVLHVQLNRPDKLNSMNDDVWNEIMDCFKTIKVDKNCRSVVISGNGRAFTSGLDYGELMSLSANLQDVDDVARKSKVVLEVIERYQNTFNAIEDCNKPVIAAIHGPCIGAGVDMICACDMRFCTSDASFSIKEIDIGIAADVGTLQRLPKAIGNDSLLREYIYTCEKINPETAKEIGIVSRIFPSKEKMMEAAILLAKKIALKSPVAVQGTKRCLTYSRDHSVKEGLEYQSLWNMTMLQSEDVFKAAEATLTRKDEPPKFSKL